MTAVISFAVVGLIVGVNSFMNRNNMKEENGEGEV